MRITKVAIFWALLAATANAGEAVPPGPSDRASSGIGASQVTIILMGPRSSRFQATVIAKRGRVLVAVTAAHCLDAAEAGKRVLIRRGPSVLSGRIGKVFRNPAYQEPRFPQLMGTDNAIVSLHVDPDGTGGTEAGALEGIRAVGVATGPIPSPDGQKVVVHISDQYGKEHVMPAGNFSNPKMLTWGPKFHPVGGDSGSGVFIVRDVPGAKPAPILIGVVAGADDRGGGASLIHMRYPWVVQSLNDESKPGRE